MTQDQEVYNVAILLSRGILGRQIPYPYTPEEFIRALLHPFAPSLKDLGLHHMTKITPSDLELAKKVSVENLRIIPLGKEGHWPGVEIQSLPTTSWNDDYLCPGISQYYQRSESAILEAIRSTLLTPLDLSSSLRSSQVSSYSGKSFISPFLNKSNPQYQKQVNIYSFAALWEATLRDDVPVGFELELRQDKIFDDMYPHNALTEYLNNTQNKDRILFPLSRQRSKSLHQNHILLVKETLQEWSLIWVEPCGTLCLGYQDIDYITDMQRIEKAVMQYFELSIQAPVKLTWKGIPTGRSVLYQRAITDLGIQGLIEHPLHLQSLKVNADVLIHWCTAITCFISHLMLKHRIYSLEDISYALGYCKRSEFRQRLILFQENAMVGYYERYKFERADCWPKKRVLLN